MDQEGNKAVVPSSKNLLFHFPQTPNHQLLCRLDANPILTLVIHPRECSLTSSSEGKGKKWKRDEESIWQPSYAASKEVCDPQPTHPPVKLLKEDIALGRYLHSGKRRGEEDTDNHKLDDLPR